MTWTFDPARYAGHTEGPWRSTVDFFGDYTIQGAEELAIAAVVNGAARELTGGGAEQNANARLIADAPRLLAEVLRLRAENERLHDRLEDNVMGDGHGNLVPCEPGSIPDGIECRDETIKLQRQRLGELAAENERLKDDASSPMEEMQHDHPLHGHPRPRDRRQRHGSAAHQPHAGNRHDGRRGDRPRSRTDRCGTGRQGAGRGEEIDRDRLPGPAPTPRTPRHWRRDPHREGKPMSASQIELQAALSAIATAELLLSQHKDLFERFARERQSFDTVAPIIDPSFWMKVQREPWREQVAAAIEAATVFLNRVGAAKAALAAQRQPAEGGE